MTVLYIQNKENSVPFTLRKQLLYILLWQETYCVSELSAFLQRVCYSVLLRSFNYKVRQEYRQALKCTRSCAKVLNGLFSPTATNCTAKNAAFYLSGFLPVDTFELRRIFCWRGLLHIAIWKRPRRGSSWQPAVISYLTVWNATTRLVKNSLSYAAWCRPGKKEREREDCLLRTVQD